MADALKSSSKGTGPASSGSLRGAGSKVAALVVAADGDEVVSGLQAEIELKAAALEKLQAECTKLEADAVVLIAAAA